MRYPSQNIHLLTIHKWIAMCLCYIHEPGCPFKYFQVNRFFGMDGYYYDLRYIDWDMLLRYSLDQHGHCMDTSTLLITSKYDRDKHREFRFLIFGDQFMLTWNTLWFAPLPLRSICRQVERIRWESNLLNVHYRGVNLLNRRFRNSFWRGL